MRNFGNVQREMEGVPYKVMYAMMATRVDIAFALSTMSQFMSKAGPLQWMAVKRIMRYVKGTLDFKLCIEGKDIVLIGFCNVDGPEMQMISKPPWDTYFFVGIEVILWKCKRQPIIALSTTEVEYMVTSHYTKESVWFRRLLADVGYVQEKPTSIMCNNEGCIALAKNPTYHYCTKHIDIRHHFIKEKLENQKMYLKYYPMEDMIADVLTRPLANNRYQALTKTMGLEAFDYSQVGM